MRRRHLWYEIRVARNALLSTVDKKSKHHQPVSYSFEIRITRCVTVCCANCTGLLESKLVFFRCFCRSYSCFFSLVIDRFLRTLNIWFWKANVFCLGCCTIDTYLILLDEVPTCLWYNVILLRRYMFDIFPTFCFYSSCNLTNDVTFVCVELARA